MQNELELQIQTNAKDTDAVLQKLISTLQKVDTTMNGVLNRMNGKNSTKNLENNIDNLSKKANKFSNAFDFTTAFNVAEKGFRGLFSLFEKSIDYSENANLFNVALDDLTEKGMQFQNTLNEAFGTNQSETLRFQGLFQAMAKSMGVANDDAYALSEGLTKIGFDLASLYNISDVSAMNKLRAGLAGQTEPLRTVGMDITENSLKPIIERLNMRDSEGELLTPRQLNYAEKMLLRYIAIVDQAKVAQGDFANTIESPANQLKILGMQAQEAGRAIGNLFVGALAKILPYANAVIMVIEEVAKAIAGVLGIEIGDYNSSVASVEDAWVNVDNTTSNIGSNLDDANKKAKKLQRTVMGFDEIHSISTPTESSSPSSGSGSGGLGSSINPALLEALGTYENGMEKVRMKANEIRDAIMEWLGFTKKINPITGETYWEYQGIDKTLENMWKSFQGLSTTGKIIVGLGLVAGATKLWNVGKKLVSVFGNTGLGKIIKATFTSQKSLFGSMLTGITSSHSSLKAGIQSWREQQGIIDSTTGKVNGFKGAINGAKNVLMGIGTSAVGLVTLSASIKNATTEGWNLVNVLGTVGGALGSIAGGAQAGAVFGTWGAVIGGAVGALGALLTSLNAVGTAQSNNQKELDKNISSLSEYTESLKESRKAIEEEALAKLTQTTYSEQLVAELENLVDANGQVKKGYEERVEFILNNLKEAYGVEYDLVNGNIKNYQDYKQKIYDVIEAKKAEILLQANEQAYADALKNEVQYWKEKEEAQKSLNEVQKEYDNYLEESKETWNGYNDAYKRAMGGSFEYWFNNTNKTKEYQQQIKDAQKTLDEADEQYQDLIDTKVSYEELSTAIITENKEKQAEAIKNLTNTYKTENGNVQLTMAESISKAQEDSEKILNVYKERGVSISDELKNQAYSNLNTIVKDLTDQTSAVQGELSDELKDAWKTLAEQNLDIYTEKIKQMPPETQKQIEEVTGVIIDETGNVVGVTKSMASSMLKEMDKGGEAKSNALNTLKGYLQGMSDEELRNLLKQAGITNADKVLNELKKDNLSESHGRQILNGFKRGLDDTKTRKDTITSVGSFASSVLASFANVFDIHSPSKETQKIGLFVGQGVGVGVLNSLKGVLPQISKFSDNVLSSIEVPFSNIQSDVQFDDYKVDLSKNINYGKITRDINTRTQVEADNTLINSIANAVVQGINAQNVNVQVDINAHTDESTIVDTAIKGINRETTRTGQCPIRVM